MGGWGASAQTSVQEDKQTATALPRQLELSHRFWEGADGWASITDPTWLLGCVLQGN